MKSQRTRLFLRILDCMNTENVNKAVLIRLRLYYLHMRECGVHGFVHFVERSGLESC